MNAGGEGTVRPAVDVPPSAARADEVGPEAPLPPARITELIAAVDKATRSQRLYQPNNPMYRGFIAAAQKVIARLWDDVDNLTFAVEEHGFRWYGRLFTMGEGRDTIPFLFYKDGIRFITLLPGFEDEFERFLDAVNRARAHGQGGDEDVVTVLWQEEFTSFQYSYVDALAEGLEVPGSVIPSLAGIELTLVRQDAATPPPTHTGEAAPPPSAAAAAAETPSGIISRDEFEETLYFLDEEELATLRREVDEEWQRDVKGAVLDALFDRLEDGGEQWRAEILRILGQLMPVFLSAGDLQSATRVLMELGSVIERDILDPASVGEARAFFEELSEPAVLRQLLDSMTDGSIDPTSAELGVFLRHLGPDAMPVLLSAAERADEGPLRERLQSALEELGGAHRGALLKLVHSTDGDVARGAVRLCGRLGVAQAAPVLGELLARADDATRRAAVEALVGIRNSTAMEAVQRALSDDDRDVRIAAARGLGALRYTPARARLESLLEDSSMRDADLTEKIAFFEAYATVAAGDSVRVLDRVLNGRRLFGRETPEMRACAAMALGRVATPAARTALQRSAEDGNPMVRTAVQKALRREPA